MKSPFRLAFYQAEDGLDTTTSMSTLIATLDMARGADLVVFPELFASCYMSGDALYVNAQPADGPAFKAVSAAARHHNVAVCYGYAERVGGEVPLKPGDEKKVFNSVQIVSKTGESLLNYRKTHLWGNYEKKYFLPGNTLPPVVDLDGTKVSALICYDMEFPEPCRCLSVAGAELIVVPTANQGKFTSQNTVAQRAQENHVFVAYINLVGPRGEANFCGLSTIAAPDGRVVMQASEYTAEYRSVQLDPDDPKLKTDLWVNPYFTDRRPELYAALAD
mmetsp:Transcript_16486/g.39236  ORF Transcript_16486/g.39236 Transcript_16486/m.39236 type:complete len:276 (-) Transcript_16486:49-876(-)